MCKPVNKSHFQDYQEEVARKHFSIKFQNCAMRGAGKRYLQESVRMDLEGTITHESRDREEYDTNVLGLQPTFCNDSKSGEEVFMP
jgi:hypothetical protein